MLTSKGVFACSEDGNRVSIEKKKEKPNFHGWTYRQVSRAVGVKTMCDVDSWMFIFNGHPRYWHQCELTVCVSDVCVCYNFLLIGCQGAKDKNENSLHP